MTEIWTTGEHYQDLHTWLTCRSRRVDMDFITTALEDSVQEEAEVLVNMELSGGQRKRKSRGLTEKCLADARDHYGEEIREMVLNGGDHLTSMQVLTYRRMPNAWAIAQEVLKRMQQEGSA